MSGYDIILRRRAVDDLDRLKKYYATEVADAMERHLQDKPGKTSKTRIKRLRGIKNPDYRLRVGDYRVFYTIDEDNRTVVVLRVMHKNETHQYLKEMEQ